MVLHPHQMCQIDMLVFVCALVTITENDIAPMALLTQGTQTLPWVRYRGAATLAALTTGPRTRLGRISCARMPWTQHIE